MINILCPPSTLKLGRKGENEFRTIEFDVAPWLADYPNGSISVVYMRPDGVVYPPEVTTTNGVTSWVITSVDTAAAGAGYAEIRLIDGDVVGKSARINTMVYLAINGTEVAPPAPDWTVVAAQLLAKIGDLDDLTTEDKSNLVAAINEAAQSDGGTGLPDVTIDDDGKVLKVIDGEWSVGDDAVGIPDAPSDGKQYARKDGAWSVVEGDTPPEVTNAIATGGIGWTDEAVTIEWDGDTTGLEEFPDPELKLYKVTDRTIPKSDIVGGVITVNTPNPTSFDIGHIFESTTINAYAVIIQEEVLAFVVLEEGIDSGKTYSVGTYLPYINTEAFTSKLQSASEIIHKIDEKYLPEIPTTLAELTGDTTHRTVTDAEKAAWDAKVDSDDLTDYAQKGDLDELQKTALTASVTIAVADWEGGTTTTKNVTGVTATNIVFCDSSDADVQCTAQGAGTLTFTASATPSAEVTVKVVILP